MPSRRSKCKEVCPKCDGKFKKEGVTSECFVKITTSGLPKFQLLKLETFKNRREKC